MQQGYESGKFLEQFFSARGNFVENPLTRETSVLCPFPHKNGYENNASAHVNADKGVFHCKTCFAEGRFNGGGLSEASFIAAYYKTSYANAMKFLQLHEKTPVEEAAWAKAMKLLWDEPEMMNYLKESRGLTDTTIRTYQLGFTGDGIAYPVFINRMLLDKRTYNPNWKTEVLQPGQKSAKIRSDRGVSELLFPYDFWKDDERPTMLVAGENDCLLTRQHGFNALCVTAGEGAFPKVFLHQFYGKAVYIIYDCDEAGRTASRTVAFHLREAGAEVRIVDLALTGSKDDKDLTDYFLKHAKTSEDLDKLISDAPLYDVAEYVEDKNRTYPLVDLSNVYHGEFSSKRLSSRVVLSSYYDEPIETPAAAEWSCTKYDSESKVCATCPAYLQDRKTNGWWILDDDNLDDILELIEVTPKIQAATLRKCVRIPAQCPGHRITVRAKKGVRKVVFTPDADTEDEESGFRDTEMHAYVLEKVINERFDMTDGERYRIFYRRYAHPLQDQKVVLVVDRAEESDNSLNTFQVTEETINQLDVFRGEPEHVMADRAERMHAITKRFKPNPMIANAVDIMYHSPLRFVFAGSELKGYPEGIVVGESRTGKTETPLMFQRYIQLGNFMPVKGATTAGLLGGAEKTGSGAFRISWGTIPRNHRGLVVLDEVSDMAPSVMASLTSMRSERFATIHKIAKGKAPAETRLLWTGNPKKDYTGKSKRVMDYPNGVELYLDLIGADEDIARFDFCMLIIKDESITSSPLDVPQKEAHTPEAYRNLILWAWSRKSDQIRFADNVESYIVQLAEELNDRYDTDVKFLGSEAWKKLARIAVSCACACFSSDESGQAVVVEKSHVDWAAKFLARCYDNNVFRLGEYVRERRNFNETNDAVNTIVAKLCAQQTTAIKILLQSASSISMQTFQAVSGLDHNTFRPLLNELTKNNLVQITAQGIAGTQRLKKAVEAYKGAYYKTKMIPLSEREMSPI